ncbi:MAG: carbamoyltransferase [Rickettsiales bacterium]|nr:carbamoyltransferase [Rickettsiales bacterium]
MRVILGINTFHTDSSACLLINGKLVAAVEEERINRKKHYSGYPIESIRECLKIGNVSEDEITNIAFNTKPKSNFIAKSFFFIKNFKLRNNLHLNRISKKISIRKTLFKHFKLNKNIKFHYIEHHLSHLASVFYPSEFEKSNGLSIDGSGDFVTLAIAECQNNKINIKEKINFPNSLGIFYHAMTQFLGFKNYGEEYKMMGLAAYGSPIYFDKIKNNLFKNNHNYIFELNLDYFNHHKNNFKYIAENENLVIDKIYNSNLSKLFEKEIISHAKNDLFKKNFAASVQKIYEYFFLKILEKIKNKNFSDNLVFAGGCALNSSANKLLTSNDKFFKNVYITFAPGDNGGALGAAFVVSAKYGENKSNFANPYLGPKFNNDTVENILKSNLLKNKLYYDFLIDDKLYLETSKLISNGNVVGWFQDQMEFGPRALGNRSILADPRNPKMKDIINLKIKRRESFRPFAPSVLEDFQSEWFDSKFYSPYMSSVAIVKNNKKSFVPAITHIDGTARLQSVSNTSNHKFYKLIKNFYNLTKVPILLNTSFNENEPIVMNPEEALDCLVRTDMDALIINNFLIRKI